jgi:hypothetical protein
MACRSSRVVRLKVENAAVARVERVERHCGESVGRVMIGLLVDGDIVVRVSYSAIPAIPAVVTAVTVKQ